MEFDWTIRKITEWRDYFRKVPRANWLQSVPFARAARVKDQKVTRLALIRREDEAIGMMALQEIKLGPVHFLELYRGPLWFRQDPPEEWFAEFAFTFNKLYPRRFLRRRRWLPEWRDSVFAQTVLEKTGFRSKAKTFETIWLDLEQPEAKIRAQFQSNWRNHLSKGERANLKLQADWFGVTADSFLYYYEADRAIKKYRARNAHFIKEEIKAALPFKDAFILWAYSTTEPIAGVLIFLHGQSASYRVGWTTPEGRKLNAHNVLLWETIKTLKAKGLKNFDLGGIVPMGAAEGVTQFKKGMGGEEYKLVGVFG